MAERSKSIASGRDALWWRRAPVGRARGRRGAALLEVVLSVSILVIAMGIIGFAFRNGQLDIDRAELRTRAMMATEQVLTNIDLATLPIVQQAEATTGGQMTDLSGAMDIDAPPGMSYRVMAGMDPMIPGTARVQVDIFNGDPTDENSPLILSTMVLRAPPRPINLGRDFGLSDEQLQQLTDAIPGGAAVLDPAAVDPKALASLDLDMLAQILPMLMQAFGGQLGEAQMQQIMEAIQSGDQGQIEQLQQQLGGAGGLPGGQGGQGAQGGQGGRGGQSGRGGQDGAGQPGGNSGMMPGTPRRGQRGG